MNEMTRVNPIEVNSDTCGDLKNPLMHQGGPQCDFCLGVLQERVVDVGFRGRWLLTDKMMAEFDINLDEWDDQGQPN